MIRRPPRSTLSSSSAASDVYKRQFLGYTFRKRTARGRGGVRNGFLPAVSNDAMKKMSRAVHGWRLHRWTMLSLDELAAWVNPSMRGWLNFYGRFYRTALLPLIRRI